LLLYSKLGEKEKLVQPKPLTREPSLDTLAKQSAYDGLLLRAEPIVDSKNQLVGFSRCGNDTLEIPLCRFMTMEAVRPIIADDVEKLYKSFVQHGYIMTGGVFYAALEEIGTKNEVELNSATMDTWDDIWKKKSAGFDKELERLGYDNLIGKMFWLWEGNHRTQAWMSAIKDLFSNREDKHISVKTWLLHGKLENQMKILQSCQDVNGYVIYSIFLLYFVVKYIMKHTAKHSINY
jgi:hypothetical protein